MKDILSAIYEALSGGYISAGSQMNFKYFIAMFDSSDYTTLGLAILGFALLGAFTFYKLWDPIYGTIVKWILMLIVTLFSVYIVSNFILSLNSLQTFTLQQEPDHMNINMFLFRINLTSALLSLPIYILASLIFKNLSVHNRKNPI